MNNPTIYILLFLITAPLFIFGQDKPYSEKITVIAPYNPSLSEAFKKQFNPVPENISFEREPLKPALLPVKNINFTTETTTIKPVKVVGQQKEKYYQNLIKGGFGTYATPYLEFFTNTRSTKKGSLGLHLYHLSSTGDIDNYATAGYSHNKMSIYGQKPLKKHNFNASIDLQRDVYHYYGYRPHDFADIKLSDDDLKQRYFLVGAHAQFQTISPKIDELRHNHQLNFYHLAARNNTAESHINLSGALMKGFDLLDAADNQEAGIEAGLQYFNNHDSINTYNSTLFHFAPVAKLSLNSYHLTAGFDGYISSDTTTEFHLHPRIKASVVLVPETFSLFAGLKGEYKKNSLRVLSNQNPYIASVMPMAYSNNKLCFYGGLRSRIGQRVNITAGIETGNVEDMALFVPDQSTPNNSKLNNQFTAVYDHVKYLRLYTEASYQYSNILSLLFNGAYNSYSPDKETEAWNRPDFEIGLTTTYTWRQKLILSTQIQLTGTRYSRYYDINNGETTITLDPFTQINLGAEYRHNKQLSGFIKLNNITNQQQITWFDYRSQGFSAMLGASFSF